MATSYLDFPRLFDRPRSLVVCVLVEGVPLVLVPAGVAATATAVSSGTVDPLWWPGVGDLEQSIAGVSHDPVRAWLDPSAVWEVYKRADVAKGEAKVEPMNFDLYDPGGQATAVVSAPRGRAAQLLASALTPSSTSAPLDATAGVPSSGVAYVGREAMVYGGVGGGSLTPLTRGAFGSRARAHAVDPTAPPVVVCSPATAPWPRHFYGRLASVWLARLDGATLVDPTPIFLGTVGPGVQRDSRGVRWQIALDSIVETLGRKVAAKAVTLYGVNHLDGDLWGRTPLSNDTIILRRASGAPDRDGWHPNMASFVDDWNAYATTAAEPVRAYLTSGKLQVRRTGLGSDGYTVVHASWDDGSDTVQADGSGVGVWTSRRDAPDTSLHFDGRMPLPVPGDAAKIPTAYYGVGTSRASFILRAEVDAGDTVTADVIATGTNGTVTYVEAYADTDAPPERRNDATLITRRTTATVGVRAEGSGTDVLLAAALALDELDGGLHAQVVDWNQVAGVLDSVPLAGVPAQRAYVFAGGDGDTILRVLVDELRLRGCSLCLRRGRLGAFRTATFAAVEETSAVITEADVLFADADGEAPVEPAVIDSPSPVVTSVRFTLPDGGYFQWVDDTHRRQWGDGDEIECAALASVPRGTDLAAIPAAVQQVAMQLLGVLAEPYRVVRVTLGPPFLGLQEGDLVIFSHPRVPTLEGTIGVAGAVCQVEEVRTEVMGGKGRVEVALRLQEPDLAGYAPEALVAAGGITGAVVTVDTSTPWGATCFARELRADGTVGDPLDGFAAGDRVVLSQIGARAPIADEPFTVSSIGSGTVTLSGSPSAGMVAAAASQYGVILRFDDWGTIDGVGGAVTARQERYLFVADAAAQDLGSGDRPKRWAA